MPLLDPDVIRFLVDRLPDMESAAPDAVVPSWDGDVEPLHAVYAVRSIPTILFFKGGKLVDQVVGAVPKAALDAKFKQHAA